MGVIHKLCIAIFLKQYSSLLKILQVILHINTALDTALTGISEDENIIIFRENHVQKEHASFLHVAINEMIKNLGVSFSEINAVSLVNGPGSYTGLRVGLAAAKGICYAMDTPLITTWLTSAPAASSNLSDLSSFVPWNSAVLPSLSAR